MILRAAGGAAIAVVLGAACRPIEPVPLTNAPVNECPCEGFAAGASQAPRCRRGRCEIPTTLNRPEFPFFIVVNVPTSSSYAPGSTFVFYSNESGQPAFLSRIAETPRPGARCIRPTCLRLGDLTLGSGTYRVSAALSLRAGYPLDERASIPVRAAYFPVGTPQFPLPPLSPSAPPLSPAALAATSALVGGLPLAPTNAFPTLVAPSGQAPFAQFSQPLAAGTYLRVLYPEPPFDELFPPQTETKATLFGQEFVLDEETLDPPQSRSLDVEREEGLDGWQVWLRDMPTRRRISTVRTLTGRSARVQVDTTGERRTDAGGLGNDVEAVLAPPASYLAVPRYVTVPFSGSFGTLSYPSIPPPVRVEGVVAEPNGDSQLLGYPARVSFTSTAITVVSATPSRLLSYETEVSTDDSGRFATVLPPGEYRVVVEPAEGTGFAKYRQPAIIDRDLTALTLQPPRRTRVLGRVLLTDGRPLAEAEILATPQSGTTSELPIPRPGRGTTGPEGRFEMLLDPGPYVITVIPKKGSGFPRVVVRPQIPTERAELPDIQVPAPSPLTFTLRDPRPGIEAVVANAVVRVFAVPGVTRGTELEDETPDPAPVEIGSAVSDANGQVEILLAPGPR
ncbi:MAG: carboxypeptidase regulatory-like domain-containing protein [Labilithrix sp.]|nr:carboxypeptidase regulatory-like domain-containing protein [Labilithrix sp.]MCW5813852.1 carboxypeptidase regulatory-like domain-containing protein [Labilithrix sp.]